MAPKTRSSAKKAAAVAEPKSKGKKGKEAQPIVTKEPTELASSEEEESDSESISSSSAEDSDDDFEVEMSKNGKKAGTDGSSGDEEIQIVKDIQDKIDRETKKKRIRKRQKKTLAGNITDNDDVICDFESKDVSKQRRRRLYRRKMMTTSGTAKRRRIKRPDMDMADDYTCDTLVQFGITSKIITTDVDWDDPEIDGRAGRRLFREIESEEEFSDQSDEDEADIIGQNLPIYMTRNSTERVSQVIELKVAPFSEKLACYNSSKSLHGATRSPIHTHHPSFMMKQDLKLPEELLWERPFVGTLYLRAHFDAHEKCNKFLSDVAIERKQETENKLMREIEQRLNEKLIEANSQYENDSELPLMEDEFDFVINDNSFEADEGFPYF